MLKKRENFSNRKLQNFREFKIDIYGKIDSDSQVDKNSNNNFEILFYIIDKLICKSKIIIFESDLRSSFVVNDCTKDEDEIFQV